MKRPMLVAGIAYAVATWCAFLFPSRQALLLAGACGLSGLFLARVGKWDLRAAALACLMGAAAFSAYALYDTRSVQPLRALEGRVMAFEGVVALAEPRGGAAEYTLQGSFAGPEPLPRNVQLALRVPGGMEFSPGDMVRANVRIYLPQSSSTELYYRARGVSATGFAAAENVQGFSGDGYRAARFLTWLRTRLRDNLYDKLSEQNAGIVSTMALGLQGDIEPELYTAVNRAGTVHLLSVSGLHLSILTAFVMGACKRLRVPRRGGNVICMAVALLFSALAGFSAPITRACIMTVVLLLARTFSRRADSLNSLGFALLVICIARPYWVLGRGLWLSAGSTFGILAFGGKRVDALCNRFTTGRKTVDRIVRMFVSAGVISVSAYAVTFPLLLFSNGWISLISPLANLLIAPFVPVALLGGVLCAAVPGVALPIRVVAAATDFCTDIIVSISQLFAALPFTTLALDEGWVLLWLLAVAAGAAVVVIFRSRALVPFALTLALLSFSLGNLSALWAGKSAVQLATIQGCDAAVLLRGGDAVILGTPSKYEIGKLLKYLDFRGVRRIHAVIAADCPDQIGSGLLRLESAYGIDCVVGPDDAYILSQLEMALPNVRVYSGGYADIALLGGVSARTDLLSDDIRIWAGKHTVLKRNEEYTVQNGYSGAWVRVFRGGAVAWPGDVPPLWEPVGAYLFGEQRFLLRL